MIEAIDDFLNQLLERHVIGLGLPDDFEVEPAAGGFRVLHIWRQ